MASMTISEYLDRNTPLMKVYPDTHLFFTIDITVRSEPATKETHKFHVTDTAETAAAFLEVLKRDYFQPTNRVDEWFTSMRRYLTDSYALKTINERPPCYPLADGKYNVGSEYTVIHPPLRRMPPNMVFLGVIILAAASDDFIGLSRRSQFPQKLAIPMKTHEDYDGYGTMVQRFNGRVWNLESRRRALQLYTEFKRLRYGITGGPQLGRNLTVVRIDKAMIPVIPRSHIYYTVYNLYVKEKKQAIAGSTKSIKKSVVKQVLGKRKAKEEAREKITAVVNEDMQRVNNLNKLLGRLSKASDEIETISKSLYGDEIKQYGFQYRFTSIAAPLAATSYWILAKSMNEDKRQKINEYAETLIDAAGRQNPREIRLMEKANAKGEVIGDQFAEFVNKEVIAETDEELKARVYNEAIRLGSVESMRF